MAGLAVKGNDTKLNEEKMLEWVTKHRETIHQVLEDERVRYDVLHKNRLSIDESKANTQAENKTTGEHTRKV